MIATAPCIVGCSKVVIHSQSRLCTAGAYFVLLMRKMWSPYNCLAFFLEEIIRYDALSPTDGVSF